MFRRISVISTEYTTMSTMALHDLVNIFNNCTNCAKFTLDHNKNSTFQFQLSETAVTLKSRSLVLIGQVQKLTTTTQSLTLITKSLSHEQLQKPGKLQTLKGNQTEEARWPEMLKIC